jgi:hypothetical protein
MLLVPKRDTGFDIKPDKKAKPTVNFSLFISLPIIIEYLQSLYIDDILKLHNLKYLLFFCPSISVTTNITER